MAISDAVTKYLAISIGSLTVCPFTRLIPLSVIFDYAEGSAWRRTISCRAIPTPNLRKAGALFEGRYVGRIYKAVSHAPREAQWF